VEEYLALPEEKPYLEYVAGVVLQKPMPNNEHSRLAARLAFHLTLHTQSAGGGHVGVEARTGIGAGPDFRLPDVSYWAPGTPAGDDSVPTLAIEIRSPGQSLNELRQKCQFLRRNGVRACWLIDPGTRSAEVFEGSAAGASLPATGALTSSHLPGFELPLSDLFSVLDAQAS
jgi:Uma2 family endonuclease